MKEVNFSLMRLIFEVKIKSNHIQIISQHTDICVVLLYFCKMCRLTAFVTVKKCNGKVIDIKAITEKQSNIQNSCRI